MTKTRIGIVQHDKIPAQFTSRLSKDLEAIRELFKPEQWFSVEDLKNKKAVLRSGETCRKLFAIGYLRKRSIPNPYWTQYFSVKYQIVEDE